MIFSADPLVIIGRIMKTHGYEGKLKLEIDDDIDIDLKEPVFLMFQEKPVPFFITEFSGSNPFIVKIDDIDTIDLARELVGRDLYIQSEEIEEGPDLAGYSLVDIKLGTIGTVIEIVSNSAQDLIVTHYNGSERLIPFVDELITEIDHETQMIGLNLPDGLLELD